MKESTKMQLAAATDGARKQGASIGMGISVIGAWIMSEFVGIEPPGEVVAAASGLITGIGAWIQRNVTS